MSEVDALIKQLKDPDPRVRGSAVKKLVGDMETVANDVVDTVHDVSTGSEEVEDEIEIEI